MIPGWLVAALGLGVVCAAWGALQVWLGALDPDPEEESDVEGCGTCSLCDPSQVGASSTDRCGTGISN